MKKLLLLVPILALLAVGCNSSPPITEQKPSVTQDAQPAQVLAKTPIPQPAIPSTNLASGWQTYSNTDLGYSISYPPDWRFTEHNGSGGCEYCLFPQNGGLGYEMRGNGFIFAPPRDLSVYLKDADVNNVGVTSLQEYLDTYTKPSVCAPNGRAGGTAYCVSYKKTTFQSIPAYLVAVDGMAAGYDILFQSKGKVHTISLPVDSKGSITFSDLTATEKSILLTYKLLK